MLTKSDYVTGNKCLKKLFFKKKAFSENITEETIALRDQGYEVESACKDILFPNAVPVTFPIPEICAADTQKLMDDGLSVYQGVFMNNGRKAVVDFITPLPDGTWALTECKSSTSVKDGYIDDVSFQYSVLKDCGVEVSKIQLALINTECVWPDKDNLFKLLDVTDLAIGNLNRTNQLSLKMIDLVSHSETPDIQCGKHCKKPSPCSYSAHCFGVDDKPTIWDIPRLNQKRETELLESGIKLLDDITPANWAECSLTDTMRKFVSIHMNKTVKFDKEAIIAELSSWSFPLVFLDFETNNTAVPKFEGTTPYEQIPFQYSFYVLHSNGDLTRRHFLHTKNTDPRPAFTASLVKDLEEFGYGNLVAYYATFEKTVMKKLAIQFPALAPRLLDAVECLEDLLMIFRHHVQHYGFKGSNSIKKVLPVILPELSYDDLGVQNGIQAQINWRALLQLSEGKIRDQAIFDAIEYCDLDSLAMVKMYHELFKICA